MFPGEAKEDLALKQCHAFPNPQNLHILLQMLKMMAIEIFVCKAFISVTTQASIERSEEGDVKASMESKEAASVCATEESRGTR
jgi:hypothetical protein